MNENFLNFLNFECKFGMNILVNSVKYSPNSPNVTRNFVWFFQYLHFKNFHIFLKLMDWRYGTLRRRKSPKILLKLMKYSSKMQHFFLKFPTTKTSCNFHNIQTQRDPPIHATHFNKTKLIPQKISFSKVQLHQRVEETV